MRNLDPILCSLVHPWTKMTLTSSRQFKVTTDVEKLINMVATLKRQTIIELCSINSSCSNLDVKAISEIIRKFFSSSEFEKVSKLI